MSYHQFTDENGSGYGSFEVFWIEDHEPELTGWHWAACFPGCLPDSEPIGPFATYELALEDALRL